MNKTTPLIVTFLGMLLVQWFIPLRMVFRQENVLSSGHTYRFRCAPIDPADHFRGRYLTLAFRDITAPFPADLGDNAGEKVFVTVREDSTGFAVIDEVLVNAPTHSNLYFEAHISAIQNDPPLLVLEYPFTRFYLEEFKAPQAEKIYFDALRDSSQVAYALVTIAEGQSQLIDVQINGRSIQHLLNVEKN